MTTDRCPGVLALHEAADGWLARVRLPGGRLTPPQLRALARVAGLGNDVVELTARANLQVRGLDQGAGETVAAQLASVGLLPSLPHERVRNLLASPLAGRHPAALADVDEVLHNLDRELCADPALSELPGRFLFLVEDGSGICQGHDHDLALVAVDRADEDARDGRSERLDDEDARGGRSGRLDDAEFALLVAGVDSGWRACAREAPALAIAAARTFLAIHEGAWRIGELAGGPTALIDLLDPAAARRSEAPLHWHSPRAALTAGGMVQRDGRVALTALVPLGRLDTSQLCALAEIDAEVRLSPWRTLTLVDLADDTLTVQLRGIGLVLDRDSGWARLSACSGLGACANAQVDVRAAAAVRAATRAPGAPAEHWSACPRRCGELPDTTVTVSADGEGLRLRLQEDRQERIVTGVDAALRLLAEPRP